LQSDPALPSRVSCSESTAYARGATAKKLSRILRGDLDTITIKALGKSPGERYATVNAFSEDLARFMRGEAILAQRGSLAYRTLKFARRHRVAIGAAGALLLTLGGGLAATSYEAKVASAQRDAALQAKLRLQTQSAAARLQDGDVAAALGIILEVLPHRGYSAEALNVFQAARAADAGGSVIVGHTDRVRTAEFSPDGTRVITASYDKTARIWDAATGQQLLVLSGHRGWVGSAAFSPDGRRIVTASFDGTARIWDAATAQEVLLLSGHTEPVRAAAFSPDGRRVVTASYDKTARIWDAGTGREIVRLRGHTDRLRAAAFSPDGRRVVTASLDKTARIWDAATGREIQRLSHTDGLDGVAFSPDGERVIGASSDNTARIWDAATGREIQRLMGHKDRLMGAAFSPDGRRVVTASSDKTARIWDAATGLEIVSLSGHTDFVTSAGFSPDGRRVITSSYDNTARIWDASPDRQIMSLGGHTGSVGSAQFSPDGRRLVTASYDKTARVWDAATGREVLRLGGHTDWVTSAAFSPDGTRIVTSSNDRTARVWDAATGRELMRLLGHTNLVDPAAFSPDGRRVVTASYDKSARVWDATTAREILRLSGHTDWVTSASFSPDGRRIVTASHDRTARIWDAATGRQIRLLSGHTSGLRAAAFSPDGQRIVTAADDRTARIWDTSTGQQLLVLSGNTDRVTAAAFTPNGQRVVTGSTDAAQIWDAGNGQLLLLLSGGVNSVALSPDGLRLLTAADDETAKIYDAQVTALDIQIGWAEAAQFDPLPSAERFELGLPARADERRWPSGQSKCDAAAAAPYDPDRRGAGVMLDQIGTEIAIRACGGQDDSSDGTGRSRYQEGRALLASGNFQAARPDFEAAIAAGYRAARVELGMLLSRASAAPPDVPRAMSLYRQAWNQGVTVAAFELGNLYEYGVSAAAGSAAYVLPPDQAQAWLWYQKAAEAGDPAALARFAEREHAAAFSAPDTARQNSRLLEAFKYYAAAAERARIEGWPDEAWRNWRYRRASLARQLAHEEMMQTVANVYDGVRRQYAPRRTLWQRLASQYGTVD
jgi:WD40 repeat protein/TPR repeat protein